MGNLEATLIYIIFVLLSVVAAFVFGLIALLNGNFDEVESPEKKNGGEVESDDRVYKRF